MKKTIGLITLLSLYFLSYTQTTDSTQTQATSHFSGVITATNNGISLLPNFMLGKPAALFDLSIGKKRLSFDPMLRFAMDGKPWVFVFWGRYKLVTNKKFTMSVGAHPAFVFRTVADTTNGNIKTYFTAQRYFAAETTPTYFFNKKLGVGIHYLYGHGLTKDLSQNTHFVGLKSIMSDLHLTKQFSLTFIPQFYYLRIDAQEGLYANATVILAKKNFPFSISSIANKAINTEIAGKDFVWNVGLNYNFNNQYIEAR
ncbi:MAG: hypothetical protein SF052_21185 [Bacteroidia bacterium]|nr:hypothetical protein [Bacteroidia bacterium]